MAYVFDDLDRRLMNLVQEGFPVVAEPYRQLGLRLGVSSATVIQRLEKLLEMGVIRRLGPVFESRKLGYRGTLCAMTVPPDRVEEVAAVINSFPGITHNYLREHQLNIWFTVLAVNQEELEDILTQIRNDTGIDEILELPAEKVYKINVQFAVGE